MSAPYSIGLRRYGVANVLSTMSGIPFSWAILATSSISMRSAFGLPSDSMKTALVLGLIAASSVLRSLPSKNVVSIPKSLKVLAKRL